MIEQWQPLHDVLLLLSFFGLWWVFCTVHEKLTTKPRGATRNADQ